MSRQFLDLLGKQILQNMIILISIDSLRGSRTHWNTIILIWNDRKHYRVKINCMLIHIYGILNISCTHNVPFMSKFDQKFVFFAAIMDFWPPLWILVNFYFAFLLSPTMSAFISAFIYIQLTSITKVKPLYICLGNS